MRVITPESGVEINRKVKREIGQTEWKKKRK